VIASTKAQYDYEASAPGELTIKEDEELIVYDREEEWLLVKVKRAERAGYVPANYCDEVRSCLSCSLQMLNALAGRRFCC